MSVISVIFEVQSTEDIKKQNAFFLIDLLFLFFVPRPPTGTSLRLWQEPTSAESERPARWLLCKLCQSQSTQKHQHGHMGLHWAIDHSSTWAVFPVLLHLKWSFAVLRVKMPLVIFQGQSSTYLSQENLKCFLFISKIQQMLCVCVEM